MYRRRKGRFHWSVLFIFALFAIGYFFMNREAAPITGRMRMIDMDPRQEAQLGLESFSQILRQSKLVKTGKEVETINKIGKKIIASAETYIPEVKKYPWVFKLIESDQANAFALPGGYVAVYTGLLPIAQNQNGLATILGHEIAHAILRHGAERMSQGKLAQWGQIAVGIAAGEMDYQAQRQIMALYGAAAQYGVILPFSRQHESEADYVGLKLLARACYDPREAPLLWERMGKNSQKSTPREFMSTHPGHETRIQNFKKWMPEALQIYQQYCQ